MIKVLDDLLYIQKEKKLNLVSLSHKFLIGYPSEFDFLSMSRLIMVESSAIGSGSAMTLFTKYTVKWPKTPVDLPRRVSRMTCILSRIDLR